MKISGFIALIIFSISLAFVAVRCFDMEEKLVELSETTKSTAEKMDTMVVKLQAGDISVSNEQLASYLLIAKESKNKSDIFFTKQGKAWGALGIFLGFLAVAQGLIVITIFVKSKARLNDVN